MASEIGYDRWKMEEPWRRNKAKDLKSSRFCFAYTRANKTLYFSEAALKKLFHKVPLEVEWDKIYLLGGR